jgi:hypothetical protein
MSGNLMRFRKLRIAWSAGWGICRLLLFALWVRSYWWRDTIKCPTSNILIASSVEGRLQSNVLDQNTDFGWPVGWVRLSRPVRLLPRLTQIGRTSWTYQINSHDVFLSVPHWFPVLLLGMFAAAPWLPWQFSLRTLLIATTLVAVALGIIVWSLR